jgi:VanZ family protein
MISSIPNLPTPKIKALDSNIRLDYVIHFLEYFILSLFFMFWRMDTDSGLKFKKVLLFIVLGMCFALLDEIYQKLIPGRTFNIIDFMYDSIGFSIGIFSMFLIALVKNKPGSVVSSR